MAFYSKNGCYYLSIPEYTRDHEIETDQLGFVARKCPRGTPNVIQYIVYVGEKFNHGAWPHFVSKESYLKIRTAYREYVQKQMELADQKRIKYEKHMEEEAYRRKHPVFEIKGTKPTTNPWKKQ